MHSSLQFAMFPGKPGLSYFSEVSQEVESGVLHWAAHIPITGNAKGLLELRDLSHDSLKMAMGTVKSEGCDQPQVWDTSPYRLAVKKKLPLN